MTFQDLVEEFPLGLVPMIARGFKAMTEQERDVVGGYTASKYRSINRFLRTGKPVDMFGHSIRGKEKQAVLDAPKIIISAIKKFKLPTVVRVFRGSSHLELGFKSREEFFDAALRPEESQRKKIGVGTKITAKAFVSTAAEKDQARSFARDLFWEITIPAGMYAMPIHRNIRAYDEDEILLAPGAKFQITSFRLDHLINNMDASDGIYIVAKCIDDGV